METTKKEYIEPQSWVIALQMSTLLAGSDKLSGESGDREDDEEWNF